jgi:hypothetical protein
MLLAKPTELDERGNALLVSIMFLSLFAAFASAQFAVVKSNVRQSSFFLAHAELHKYAESGIELATYDAKHNNSGNEGNIGTENWALADDVGADGLPGTGDAGEGDGIPTFGEPNVQPVAVGPAELNASLTVFVQPTASPLVQRVVATAMNADATVRVETFLQQTPITLPRSGALYVSPTVALDLKGNSFLIDGNDHDINGNPTGGSALWGISTGEGATPGDNAALLLSQIASNEYDQIVGQGSDPSVGEVSGVAFDDVFDALQASHNATIASGSYSDPDFGDAAAGDFPVTYASGDIHLTGNGGGAGVLIVDGSVKITGQFEFVGLIIVRGDIVLSGGGAGVHVYGGVMVGESFTAVDPEGEISVAGQADIYYSSEALALVENSFVSDYAKVSYDDK